MRKNIFLFFCLCLLIASLLIYNHFKNNLFINNTDNKIPMINSKSSWIHPLTVERHLKFLSILKEILPIDDYWSKENSFIKADLIKKLGISYLMSTVHNVWLNFETLVKPDEPNSQTRYLYAVMNTAIMSEKDFIAVGDYLACITNAKVLIVDTKELTNAQRLYTILQNDIKQRGGTIVGIQIFGTPDRVPTFKIKSNIQVVEGISGGDSFLTDLFYSNFNSEVNKLNSDYNIIDHMTKAWNVDLIPEWPVVRLPLNNGEYESFFKKYKTFIQNTGLKQLPIVNFFAQYSFKKKIRSDNIGCFLSERLEKEFHLINVPYRIYCNIDKDFPVTHNVLGDFKEENFTIENQKEIVEFLVNSHGNYYGFMPIDNENGFYMIVNMNNITRVLSENYYYLDTLACLNGQGMDNNLTTTALKGNCVGVFSATTVFSGRGLNWNSSLSDMANGNFFFFLYNYFKALNNGQNRSEAFFIAQREYGKALISISKLKNKNEDDFQSSLHNLLVFHNFGVIEPDISTMFFWNSKGYINQSRLNK